MPSLTPKDIFDRTLRAQKMQALHALTKAGQTATGTEKQNIALARRKLLTGHGAVTPQMGLKIVRGLKAAADSYQEEGRGMLLRRSARALPAQHVLRRVKEEVKLESRRTTKEDRLADEVKKRREKKDSEERKEEKKEELEAHRKEDQARSRKEKEEKEHEERKAKILKRSVRSYAMDRAEEEKKREDAPREYAYEQLEKARPVKPVTSISESLRSKQAPAKPPPPVVELPI